MGTMMHSYRLSACAAVAVAAMTLAACGLDNQQMPALSGPSEFALSLALTATPDQLPRDGSSQSVVTVTVRDPQGHGVVGQRIALSLAANAPAGAGLSQSEVVTGAGGQASFSVTAPVSGSLGNIVVTAIPIGTNADNGTPRIISIAATPANTSAPTAAFTFTPPAPEVGEVVTFDASTSRDEGVACGTCTYIWNFGGEGTATGIIAKHAFQAGGSYTVTLTLTDVGGSTGTVQQTVPVTAPGPASVSFTFSPAVPIAGQTATFTSTSVAANNHRIVSFVWTWGDGSTSTTVATTIQHTFDQAGTFPVTLTVRDDLGQSATVTTAVTVSSGLVPVLTQSPSGSVAVGQTVFFDASGSTSTTGTKITNYLFDFGDGSSQSSSFSSAKHEYAAAGSYLVKLTITDEKGRTASTTTVNPGAPGGGGNVTVTP
jgi:PKD repeat protein